MYIWLLQEIASQLAGTPQQNSALNAAQAPRQAGAPEEAPAVATAAGPIEDVVGQGTPQDFSSVVCNAGSPAGKPLIN